MVFGKPVRHARVGQKYRDTVRANRSLGDLTTRMQSRNQGSGYFDIQKPRFTLQHRPRWLKIDEVTGVLSGIPDSPGAAEVVVGVT